MISGSLLSKEAPVTRDRFVEFIAQDPEPRTSWGFLGAEEPSSATYHGRTQPVLPLCPDFVAELRSSSDSPRVLRAKMMEYLANGAPIFNPEF